MASLDSLPPDQRAVLQLVLQRGRSYDQIAALLAIDRDAVRQRALAGLVALGPQTRVDDERRGLVSDYLLGQLATPASDDARDSLAGWPRERAWARVVASELAPLATDGLPEIPSDGPVRADAAAEAEQAPAQDASTVAAETGLAPEPEKRRSRRQKAPPAPTEPKPSKPPKEPREPRSSRVGGAILIGAGVVIALAVVIIVVASGSDNKKTHTSSVTTPAASTSTPTSTTSATRVVAQINLVAPGGGSRPAGVAQVVKQGANSGIIIVAQGVIPNTKHNAYAVWLFKPPSTSKLLGFVNPGVGTNGRLQTAGGLPTNASAYTELLVTLETQANPKSPGQIILQGNVKLG